jgi:hypothetical protein
VALAAATNGRAFHADPAAPALGDDVVDAGPDQPEAEYQGHDDDHLVGMGIDPAPQPGEELLRWLGAEPGVDLHGQERGGGDDAEQLQRQVILPGGELGLMWSMLACHLGVFFGGFGLPSFRYCRIAISSSPAPMASLTASAASEGAVLGFGGLFPVTRTVIAITITSDRSQPKMNAAPFRTPPFDARTRMNAVSGIGSSVITKPMRTRLRTSICPPICWPRCPRCPGSTGSMHPWAMSTAGAAGCANIPARCRYRSAHPIAPGCSPAPPGQNEPLRRAAR